MFPTLGKFRNFGPVPRLPLFGESSLHCCALGKGIGSDPEGVMLIGCCCVFPLSISSREHHPATVSLRLPGGGKIHCIAKDRRRPPRGLFYLFIKSSRKQHASVPLSFVSMLHTTARRLRTGERADRAATRANREERQV